MKKEINGVEIELTEGDITSQTGCDAVVNAANAELMPGGGVAGAIHRAAGPELAKECSPLAPIKPGEAVITNAFELPNKYVIHCLGPVYGVDKPEDELLRNCYINSLKIADENKLKCIAFPAISTGAFGYPMKPASEIALNAAMEMAEKLQYVKKIKFVLFGRSAEEIHVHTFKELTGSD